MQRQATLFVSIAMMISFALMGCGPQKKVARVDTNTQTDLSGKWNDTDARLTSEALIKDCFERPWLSKFTKDKGRPPKVRVRNLTNKSDEHIAMDVFVKNIERAMVNSGTVEVVSKADDTEMGSMHDEQKYGASGNVSDESAPSIGNEEGADFVLVGTLQTIVDQADGQKVVLYKTTMQLIDSSSAKKVWMGDHEIKKVLEQAKAGW
jgi:penicillin-binding protein activator